MKSLVKSKGHNWKTIFKCRKPTKMSLYLIQEEAEIRYKSSGYRGNKSTPIRSWLVTVGFSLSVHQECNCGTIDYVMD